jgi:lysyl-tRNA synthetase, class I
VAPIHSLENLKAGRPLHWADLEAAKTSGAQTVNDSKTPSGPIHAGALRGVVLHDALARAVSDTGRPVRYLYGFDDFDPLDAVPPGLPHDLLAPHLGRPLCDVPAPMGDGSYSNCFMDEFVAVFSALGVQATLYRTSALYRAGRFNDAIEHILTRSAMVREVYLTVSGSAKGPDWLPFNVICERCGRIATTRAYQFQEGEVQYHCLPDAVSWTRGCDYRGSVRPFDGAGKLPWKLEWVAKWHALGVTLEGAGKDHTTAGGSRDVADALYRQLYAKEPPLNVPYEFWLTGQRKMSTSAGVGLGCGDIARLISPALLRFLILRPRPQTPIMFDPAGDSIPRLFDEYDRLVRAANGDGPESAGARRLLSLCQLPGQEPPKIAFPLPFIHLAVLAQIPGTDLRRRVVEYKGSSLSTDEAAELDRRLHFVRTWLAGVAPPNARFVVQPELPAAVQTLTPSQRELLAALAQRLAKGEPVGARALHDCIHEEAEARGLDKNEVFRAVYLAVLGRDTGPRAGVLLAGLDREFVRGRFEAASRPSVESPAVKEHVSMTGSPLFDIDPAVRKTFPEIKVGMAVIQNLCVTRENPALAELVAQRLNEVRDQFESVTLAELPRVRAFRQIYRRFGVDPGSRRPSAEALLRRVLGPAKGLYRINSVVDAYNLASVEFQLPMAAYDVDRLAPPVLLRFAVDGELHRGIGQPQAEQLAAGELVYADQRVILCRDFNYRDADETKITLETRNVAVFVDGCDGVSAEELLDALQTVTERIVCFSGGSVRSINVFPVA